MAELQFWSRESLPALLAGLGTWMRRSCVSILRVGLGVIYLWFGTLKLFPGWSPAEGLVIATIDAAGGLIGIGLPVDPVIALLAVVEIAIGLGFLLRRFVGYALVLFAVHIPGTALPMILLPDMVWHHFPVGLTLEGQYIIKNLSLIGGAVGVAVASYGHTVLGPPRAAGNQVRPRPARGPAPSPVGQRPLVGVGGHQRHPTRPRSRPRPAVAMAMTAGPDRQAGPAATGRAATGAIASPARRPHPTLAGVVVGPDGRWWPAGSRP